MVKKKKIKVRILLSILGFSLLVGNLAHYLMPINILMNDNIYDTQRFTGNDHKEQELNLIPNINVPTFIGHRSMLDPSKYDHVYSLGYPNAFIYCVQHRLLLLHHSW